MTNEQAIDIITEYRDKLYDTIPCDMKEALDIAIKTLDLTKNQAYDKGFITAMKLYSRPQGKWIPVSERLPDKNMPCLVSVGKLNLTKIAMYSDLMETIDHKIFYQGDYGKDNFQNITEYVNAWQPLPEPYRTDMRGRE